MKKIENAVTDAGAAGRLGTWSYSIAWSTTAALAEYGKNIVEGNAKLGNVKDLWAAFSSITPGAEWTGGPYTDVATGTTMRNVIMAYQDTYIFGKGYMDITNVKVPEKYMRIK
jgi:hypothetical protein